MITIKNKKNYEFNKINQFKTKLVILNIVFFFKKNQHLDFFFEFLVYYKINYSHRYIRNLNEEEMLIDASQKDIIRVAMIQDNSLLDYESEKIKNDRIKGNIYLAKIVRVEPSLQAAFVDYGGNKHGFLAYNEIHPDYFKIPTADKKKLLQQELEASKTVPMDEEDEEEEDFISNQDNVNSQEKLLTDQKGFLSKVFDFFNYKPIDEFPHQKNKKEKKI